MRNFCFRGKTFSGRWVYGSLAYEDGVPAIFESTNADGAAIVVKERTIGLNTGTKDKSGKEIFEGDIVQLKMIPEYYEVIWNDEIAAFTLRSVNEKSSQNWCETSPLGRTVKYYPAIIVGNIHDSN